MKRADCSDGVMRFLLRLVVVAMCAAPLLFLQLLQLASHALHGFGRGDRQQLKEKPQEHEDKTKCYERRPIRIHYGSGPIVFGWGASFMAEIHPATRGRTYDCVLLYTDSVKF
jgi:hypothetical protein